MKDIEETPLSPTLQKSVEATRAAIKKAFEQRKRPGWMKIGKAIGRAIAQRKQS